MMYTYEFTYDEGIDGFGFIQFCGENLDEATELFTDWLKENDYVVDEYYYEKVYCPEDAEVYGDNYGGFQ